jgi:MFS family permease
MTSESLEREATLHRLPSQVFVLGTISLLTAMSSAMVYGLLPLFLVHVLGATILAVGFIEGVAEGLMSFARIASGLVSDLIGRRKPLVLLGYGVSALNKVMFPLAGAVSVVLAARVIDRIGKGLRDAPRDAYMTDVMPAKIRGSGFGLRLSFYTVGYVIGPAAAMALMAASGNNFRLVFWVAVIPAVAAMLILFFGIRETAAKRFPRRPLRLRRSDLSLFKAPFWWAIAVAGLLSLARFSPAFLVLKAQSVGIEVAFVPIVLIVMHLVYAITAYPFGVVADQMDRRRQLAIGGAVLLVADIILASAAAPWWSWSGLILGAAIGRNAGSVAVWLPMQLPNNHTAFGIYDMTVGAAAFVASISAGGLWTVVGPASAFAFSCMVAAAAIILVLFRPRSGPANGPA